MNFLVEVAVKYCIPLIILGSSIQALDTINILPWNADLIEASNCDDQPLLLSPYIERGDIETARRLSKVGPLPNAPDVPSYSGLLTVNKEYNSNLFFWFFPAMNNDVKAPFTMWLQGGPGTSDLFGLFTANSPYVIFSNMSMGLREYNWATKFNVLYVDNPVGTGFSFTDNEKGYATTEEQVADDLYQFLEQFFKLYYEYNSNDFYITGESYGGKHAPYLGYKFHVDGPPANVNFKGISIGNGVLDPEYMLDFGDYLYQLGIVDIKQASVYKEQSKLVLQLLQNGEYYPALREANKFMGFYTGSDIAEPSYLTEFSGYEFYDNFLFTQRPEDYLYYRNYIQLPQSRKAIHVGNLQLHGEETVQHYLRADIMKSPKDKIALLMDNYKVLIYSGLLDVIIPYVFAEKALQNLPWKYADEYKRADRKIWRLNNSYVAGYVKNVGNFFEVAVRNAGHFVPHDQPEAGLDLITRFIRGIPYN